MKVLSSLLKFLRDPLGVSQALTSLNTPSTSRSLTTSVTPVAGSPGLTDDRLDPRLVTGARAEGQNEVYLVLPDEERAKGFVRNLYRSYKHLTCGHVTTMGLALAETYARDPGFYGRTYCAHCGTHFPVGEHGQFVWVASSGRVIEKDGEPMKVGT